MATLLCSPICIESARDPLKCFAQDTFNGNFRDGAFL